MRGRWGDPFGGVLRARSPAACRRVGGGVPRGARLRAGRHGTVPFEPFDPVKVAHARLVAFAVPMHTALPIGVRDRSARPRGEPGWRGSPCPSASTPCSTQDRLLAPDADSSSAARPRRRWSRCAESLARGGTAPPAARCAAGPGRPALPVLERLRFAVPRREAPATALAVPAISRPRRPAPRRRVHRGEPRLPAPLPALPDPAGLRRPLLRRAAEESSSTTGARQIAAGAAT